MERIIKFINKFSFLFFWIKFFYPKSKGIPLIYLLYFLIPQKIFRINGTLDWPVHFTSRILYPKNISVGNASAPGMTGWNYIQARNKIIIGSNLKMGPGVGLISANHDFDDYDKHTKEEPIRIGNNVWIGMNSVILPGVSIGDNVIIGAGSIVTKNIPSDVVAAGNPCKVIKTKGEYTGKNYDLI